jgi:multimeric flavodoxin WrbA
MDKVILGISGSPRKFGNCELFIKEIYRQLGPGWQLRLARLPERDIKPCRACYQCLFGEMRCPQQDDFLPLLEALMEADAYIVAAPTYLLSANGSLKKFIDRGLQFYALVDRLWKKPAVGVAIAGIEGMEGSTKLDVDNFIQMTMGDSRGSVVIYGALPGETLLSDENRETAARLAQAILDPEKRIRPEGPVCPLCGGDTFRFLSDGGIRCMLCSGSGKWDVKEGTLQFEVAPPKHPLRYCKEDVFRHAEWLRGMKDQFLARKKELKEVTRKYLGVGTSI